jgi:predicted dehydrogenase
MPRSHEDRYMNRRQFFAATAAGVALAARAADSHAKLLVAVIGHTGRGNFGHDVDTMWLHVPETEIAAVADADAQGLAAAQKRLKVAQGFSDFRRMLAETQADIVAVCPRHIDQHRDMALAAIAAGARGIYVEKPFCRTPAEADAIVAACAHRNVKLAVAHRNRYHPVLPVVDRMVKDGAIGRLLEIRGRGKEDERGGALDLWVLGPHLLNLAHYFAGRPLACAAVLLQDGRPATRGDVQEGAEGVGPIAGNELHARFEMQRGVPVFFESVRKAGNRAASFGLQLVGTQGIIDLRMDTDPIAHLLPGSPFLPTGEPRAWTAISTAGAGKPEPMPDVAAQVRGHLLAARDLIAAIRENRPPLCSAEDGRVTVEMICAVFESHRLDGRRVTLPLQTRQNPLAML